MCSQSTLCSRCDAWHLATTCFQHVSVHVLVHPNVSQVFDTSDGLSVRLGTGGSEGGALCWAGGRTVGGCSSGYQGAGACARAGARGLRPRCASRAGWPGAGAGCQSMPLLIYFAPMTAPVCCICIIGREEPAGCQACRAPLTPRLSSAFLLTYCMKISDTCRR